MEALNILARFIEGMRHGEPFDLELSIDEHPPEVFPFDCLASEVEEAFILAEAKRRGVRITHLAPNLGVEKHADYRYRDGLDGLEARTRALYRIAEREGVVIDVHSGDDPSESTRRALKRATGGMIHFKISPCLQVLFADVLYDVDPKSFGMWWDDTYAFVRENAGEGSALAARCLKRYESDAGAEPHPKHALFRLFCCATIERAHPIGDASAGSWASIRGIGLDREETASGDGRRLLLYIGGIGGSAAEDPEKRPHRRRHGGEGPHERAEL